MSVSPGSAYMEGGGDIGDSHWLVPKAQQLGMACCHSMTHFHLFADLHNNQGQGQLHHSSADQHNNRFMDNTRNID